MRSVAERDVQFVTKMSIKDAKNVNQVIYKEKVSKV